MAEQQKKQSLPGFVGKSSIGNKSAFLAALVTSVLALLLILLLWLYSPSYVVLLQNLDSETATRVSAELQKHKIAFRYESESGNIAVPENSLYHAKFILGSQSIEQERVSRLLLDRSTSSNPDSKPVNLSSANFALESELAKTIASIDNIQWARVHLAIENTGKATDNNSSRASVFVRLIPGRGLGESQLASISHLVASSAANLSAENVTVIDQAGNLLKSSGGSGFSLTSSTQYSYTRILEQSYINKLEKVLNPVFGENSVRVQVDAEVIFQNSNGASQAENQDKASHVLKKLTTTVVIDNKLVKSDEGQWVSIPRRNTELERVEMLVKDTIGFNEQRGDYVHVFNESFGDVHQPESQNGGFLTQGNKDYYLKVLIIVFLGFAISYFVLRYLIQKFIEMKPLELAPEVGRADNVAVDSRTELKDESLETSDNIIEQPTVMSAYEALLVKTRQQVNNNPANVARVIRSWVRDNDR